LLNVIAEEIMYRSKAQEFDWQALYQIFIPDEE
jgi:hypothetical protein